MTNDIDISTRPDKWKSRGEQPEVKATVRPPLLAINELAARIREETDPVAKARLEVEYRKQEEELDALSSCQSSANLKGALSEMVDTFSVIVDPPDDMTTELAMPESMNREQWLVVHERIIKCKRAAAGWVSKSRRFATERWGQDFVTDAEVQMELALGIEAPTETPSKPDDVAKVMEFFVTDLGDYITGQNLAVCGGAINF